MRPIDLTDKAIMRMILEHAKQMNAWLRIGEPMSGPTGLVRGGKIVTDRIIHQDPPANAISVKNPPANLPVPPIVEARAVTVGSVIMNLNDIVHSRTSGLVPLDFRLTEPTYIYPYVVSIENREWLEKFDVGDRVSIAVPCHSTFTVAYADTVLTQQMIDENSSVTFRFAMSTA